MPLFGAHLTTDEYEHVLVFDNKSSSSYRTYDAALGLMIEKLEFDGKVKRDHNFRPTFGGFFLNDSNDFKKNIAGSIDDVGDYYNTDKVYDNDDTTKHALSLLGYSKKDYFASLKVREKTEFNFWRAMINAKGTNYAIDSFLNSVKFEHAKIDEFWAYKIAEYGDARTVVYPEVKLNVNDCFLKHTRLFFENFTSTAAPATYISVTPTDEQRWFALTDLNTELYFEAEQQSIVVDASGVDQVIQLPPADAYTLTNYPVGGTVTWITQSTIQVSSVGSYFFTAYLPAKPKFSPIKLFDYVDKALIEDITTWHPAFGNHSALALEVVNVISEKDPALYNYSTLTAQNPNYDPNKSWGDREVGRTWWDQNLLDYVPYYDKQIFSNFEERLARWGSLAEYANINLYEWVKSNLPPSLYDAQSTIDQLSGDVVDEEKKTGKAARKQTYKRNRTWTARPIAWSYVPTPPESQDVNAFKAGTSVIMVDNTGVGQGIALLTYGRFSQFGLAVGTHFAAYDQVKPVGEAVIVGPIGFSFGGSVDEIFVWPGDGTYFDLIKIVQGDNKNYHGAAIGNIDFSIFQQGLTYYIKATERGSGVSVVQTIYSYTGIVGQDIEIDFTTLGIKLQATLAVGTVSDAEAAFALQQRLVSDVSFSFEIFEYSPIEIIIPLPSERLDNALPIALPATYTEELTVEGESFFVNVVIAKTSLATIGTYSVVGNGTNLTLVKNGTTLIASIPLSSIEIDPLDQVKTYNLIDFTITVEVRSEWFTTGLTAADVIDELSSICSVIVIAYDSSSNDLGIQASSEILQPNTGYGWIGWQVPTQADLDADLLYPSNSWKPIYGDYAPVPSTRPIIDAIVAFDKEALTLNDGTLVDKYNPVWSDWVLVDKEVKKGVGSGTTITFSGFANRLTNNTNILLYVNGVNQPRDSFSIDFTSMTVTSSNIIPLGYHITLIVLGYEPSASELAFDPDVKDVPSIQVQYKIDYQYVVKPTRDSNGNITGNAYYFWVKDKTIPVGSKVLSTQQATQLLTEGPSTYLTFQELDESSYCYRGVTIAGLNYLVDKDDTYKIRFTRDFTLRDDPLDLDLKNTHTEWMLLREKQSTRIPQQLWDKLVDSAAGANLAGQTLPSLSRIGYDERHGTRTRYGFGADQILAERSLIIASLTNSILNPKTTVYANGINTTAIILGLDLTMYASWFETSTSTRQTLDYIWRHAMPQQVNELFFEVLNDALSNNYEFTDLFKTSRLSAHSIITITPELTTNNADVYY